MKNKEQKVKVRFYDIEWEGENDFPNEVIETFIFPDNLSDSEIENEIDNGATEWLCNEYDAEVVYETNFEILNK